MYGTFTATTAAAAGATGGAMRVWQRAGLGSPTAPGARAKRPAAGSATWATPQELRRLRVRRPEPGRVILGRTNGLAGRLLADEDCHSVLVFGPPDSFKTSGLVIPAILEWTGPVLATSVKPDVIKATRAHRERRGEVVVLDPLGSSGLARARWTPLAAGRTWAGAQQMAEVIAATADHDPRAIATADHQYWKTLGTKLLAPMLFAAALDGRSMTDVLRWIDLRDDHEVTKLLSDSEVDGAITAWEASQTRTDKARDSVYGTAEHLLAIYSDQRVQHFTSGHDLDEAALLSGDHTLYLYAPVHEQRRRAGAAARMGHHRPRPRHPAAQRLARPGPTRPPLRRPRRHHPQRPPRQGLPLRPGRHRRPGTGLQTDRRPGGGRDRLRHRPHRPRLRQPSHLLPAAGAAGGAAAAAAGRGRGHLRAPAPGPHPGPPHFTPREQRWRARLQRQAAQQQARHARRAARAHQRAQRRAARQQSRVRRHLPGWARVREEAGRDR